MTRGGLTNLRIDGEEELPLVSPDPGVSDSLHQLGVFVDEPGLSQHVGCCVLQLKYKQFLVLTYFILTLSQLAIYLKQTTSTK